LFITKGGGGTSVGTVVAGADLGWSNTAGQDFGAPIGTWVLHGAILNRDGLSPDSTTLGKRIA
ncbi:phage tail protein, partial [Pseudomonas sp. NPDC098747]